MNILNARIMFLRTTGVCLLRVMSGSVVSLVQWKCVRSLLEGPENAAASSPMHSHFLSTPGFLAMGTFHHETGDRSGISQPTTG